MFIESNSVSLLLLSFLKKHSLLQYKSRSIKLLKPRRFKNNQKLWKFIGFDLFIFL